MRRLEDLRLLVFADFFPPLTGGTQVTLREICARLPPQTTVVYTSPVPGDQDFDRLQAYRVIRSEKMRPLWTVWPELTASERKAAAKRSLYGRWFAKYRVARWVSYVLIVIDMIRAARHERADVIYCGHPFLAGIASRFHQLMTGVPYVVASYGEELGMLLRSKQRLARGLQRWALKGASMVFGESEFSREVLLAFGVAPDRIRLQPAGISDVFLKGPNASPSEVRHRLGIADGDPVVLTAARLMKRKGIDTVIQALPKVLAVFPRTAYLVVGGGADEDRLRRLAAETGMAERVMFLGDMPQEHLVNYIHVCDVFAMPCRMDETTGETEVFGIVFIEVSACGKPVIGGRVGGVMHAIEDGVSGLLVDPTDVAAVAESIVRLLKDPQMARQLGENGRRRARERFSWEKNAAEVREALEGAFSAARSGRKQAL